MVNFEQRKAELGLKVALPSSRGTMFLADSSHIRDIDGLFVTPLVRRLDGFVTPELRNAYVEMVEACDAWVAAHPELDRVVRVMPLLEVGEDFIVRAHIPYTSTAEYENTPEDEVDLEVPGELAEMRAIFREAQGKLGDPKSMIIERVLARNLLRPSGLTFFDEEESAFIVIEPHIRAEDLEEFARLG